MPGVVVMRSMNFRWKAIIISLAFMVPLLTLVGWLLNDESIKSYEERKTATRELVEVAHGVVTWAHKKETSGELNTVEAQQLAMTAVQALRYNSVEYFWINDMHPTVVMHPIKPELDGKDVSNLKDPNGLALFKAFVDKVQQDGQGFVPYMWPKPGHETPVEKLSYVKGFKPWGWVIGSGIYVDDLREEERNRTLWAGSVLGLSLLCALYIFICFYKVNKGGMAVVSQHLIEISEGDLRKRPVNPWGNDEPAQLILGLHKVYDAMHELIRGVRHTARELAMTSDEISKASVDLSSRTEDAASNLAQQAASMEEIGSQVSETASKAQLAAASASKNAVVVDTGGQAIAEVVQTMHDIHTSSARIQDIIGVIDGIAFQTNILALNAAVEAARAGEQGRGFAVVASEVRQLAGRSAEAAKEIKTLITNSVEKVDRGTQVVQSAGSTMKEVLKNADEINQYLSEISIAASQQATAVEEAGKAIHDLDANTQMNAALVEETSAAAMALNEQAHKLTQEIQKFRVA